MEQTVLITDAFGIHARPASVITKKACEFKGDVYFIYNGNRANAKSIIGLMSLGIKTQTEVTVETTGEDAEAALEAVVAMMKETKLI